jgi:hypothetical protein
MQVLWVLVAYAAIGWLCAVIAVRLGLTDKDDEGILPTFLVIWLWPLFAFAAVLYVVMFLVPRSAEIVGEMRFKRPTGGHGDLPIPVEALDAPEPQAHYGQKEQGR